MASDSGRSYLGGDLAKDRSDAQSEPHVSYRHAPSAMQTLDSELGALMRSGVRRICDVGGGANPVVAVAEIKRFGLEYVVLDTAREELDKAPSGYDTVLIDIDERLAVERLAAERGPFDVVVSRWTAEHVPNGRHFHEQVRRLLRPSGTALHLFPTLYSPVFILNRMLPPAITARVVPCFDKSGREPGGAHATFRSYYSWCRGPTPRQLERLASVGFLVRRYVGFFGHPYYERVRPVRLVHETLSHWLVRHPCPVLTSYALIVVERDH
jgi:SAM-dependent methyltransferase